jgi:hypothetical protein
VQQGDAVARNRLGLLGIDYGMACMMRRVGTVMALGDILDKPFGGIAVGAPRFRIGEERQKFPHSFDEGFIVDAVKTDSLFLARSRRFGVNAKGLPSRRISSTESFLRRTGSQSTHPARTPRTCVGSTCRTSGAKPT